MINKVSSVEGLRAEKVRLQIRKESLEDAIKDDIHKIKEHLNPLSFLKKNARDQTGENGILNQLFGASLGFGLDFFVRRLFLRKSGFLKKAILSLLITTLGSKVLADKSGAILSIVKNFIEKLGKDSENKNYTYDQTTAADEH